MSPPVITCITPNIFYYFPLHSHSFPVLLSQSSPAFPVEYITFSSRYSLVQTKLDFPLFIHVCASSSNPSTVLKLCSLIHNSQSSITSIYLLCSCQDETVNSIFIFLYYSCLHIGDVQTGERDGRADKRSAFYYNDYNSCYRSLQF